MNVQQYPSGKQPGWNDFKKALKEGYDGIEFSLHSALEGSWLLDDANKTSGQRCHVIVVSEDRKRVQVVLLDRVDNTEALKFLRPLCDLEIPL